MANSQLQRVTLEKNFFWHGVLTVNESAVFSFFDVKTKKDVPDSPNMIGLNTSDVPAIPMTVSDTMHISFNIENNIGANASRFRVCEATFYGSELTKAIEESKSQPFTYQLTNETGEWSFQYQENAKVYVLRGLTVFVPLAQLRKYVKDP